MTQTAKFALSLAVALAASQDLGAAEVSARAGASLTLTDGAAANQANKFFADTRTIAASGTDTLDLVGTLTDTFGALINFTKIKAIVVVARGANVNDVVIGGAVANGFVSPFGAATDKVKVKPGGAFAIFAPDVNGYAVTAATADLLQIANSAAGTSVTYDIVIVGV